MSKLLNEEQLLENQMRLLGEAKRIARRSKPTMVRELKQSVLRFQMKGSDSQNLQQVQADLLGAFPPSTHKLLDGYLQAFLGTKDFGALIFALKKQLTEEAVGALVHQNEESKLEIVLSTIKNLDQYSLFSKKALPSRSELRLIFAIAATVRECIPSKWRKLFKQIQGRTGKVERRGSKVITYTLEGVELKFSGGDAKRRSEETASSVIAKAYADSLSARELSPEIECALLGAYSSIFGRERGEETGMLPARSRPSGFFALCSKQAGLLAIEGSDLEPEFNTTGHQEACLAMKILANFCQDLYEAASQ
jgi:hypothetical protein